MGFRKPTAKAYLPRECSNPKLPRMTPAPQRQKEFSNLRSGRLTASEFGCYSKRVLRVCLACLCSVWLCCSDPYPASCLRDPR